jgi:hypothetical protein
MDIDSDWSYTGLVAALGLPRDRRLSHLATRIAQIESLAAQPPA